jgi:hypothetical protein
MKEPQTRSWTSRWFLAPGVISFLSKFSVFAIPGPDGLIVSKLDEQVRPRLRNGIFVSADSD